MLTIALCVLSCTKYETPNEITEASLITKSISVSDFQTYLYNLDNNIPTIGRYTIEEAVYGIEYLINNRYLKSAPGVSYLDDQTVLTVPVYTNYLDLYHLSHNFFLSERTRIEDNRTKIVAFDIDFIKEENNQYLVGVRSIYKTNDVCINDSYKADYRSCTGPFDEDDEYYTWLGGTEFIDVWDNSEIDCQNECGGIGPCNVVENFAMEQMETAVNNNIPDPVCPGGGIWNGDFTDQTILYGLVEWDSDLFIDCVIDFEDASPNACSCWNGDQLNCVFCKIFEEFENPDSEYFYIPDGYAIITTNIGVDYIATQSPETRHTAFSIAYLIGIPTCSTIVSIPPEPQTPLTYQVI